MGTADLLEVAVTVVLDQTWKKQVLVLVLVPGPRAGPSGEYRAGCRGGRQGDRRARRSKGRRAGGAAVDAADVAGHGA